MSQGLVLEETEELDSYVLKKEDEDEEGPTHCGEIRAVGRPFK